MLEKVTSHIATIDKDHKITLPPEMPVGAKVVVTIVPMVDDATRRADFEAALSVVRSVPQKPRVEISDAELDALIERARKRQI